MASPLGLTIKSNVTFMSLGDCIPCRYTASSGVVGTFSELGTCVASEIPTTGTATPDGLFYFIHCGFDSRDRIKLIPDRNLQTTISWDTINTTGILSNKNIDFSSEEFSSTIKGITGGTALVTSDWDDEWDKIIVSSTLNGLITAGNDSVWHWAGIASWTSSTGTTSANRVLRGNASVITTNAPTGLVSSSALATNGFRPMLLIKILLVIRYLVKDGTLLKTITAGNLVTVCNTTDSGSVIEAGFLASGLYSLTTWTNSLMTQVVTQPPKIAIYKRILT